MANQQNRNKRRRSAAVYTPIAALLVLVLLIFGISVFFRVGQIEVTGSAHYSAEEVIAVSGVEPGDNLLFIDGGAAARRIVAALPYVSKVRVERRLPDTAVIELEESAALAEIASGGLFWSVGSDGRLLEQRETRDASLIRVTGVTLVSPKAGDKLQSTPGFETQQTYLLELLAALAGSEIDAARVSDIDMTNISAITFLYDTRVKVILGSGDDAPYKLQRLLTALSQVGDGFQGRIDLSKEEIHAIPET